MKLTKYFAEDKIRRLSEKNVAGIDIGSRQAKAVLLSAGEIYTALLPTGFFMEETADELLELLCSQSSLDRGDIDYIVGTGYGRVSIHFEEIPFRVMTEIACHGMGAHFLGEDIRTVIDIGGQDSKAIRIDPENGKVLNFAMNDKCAAGTGRFLEKIANILEMDVEEMGPAALQADAPEKIDSQCVVFAESEVITSRAKGASAQNLVAGVHNSVAKRVNGLLSRVGIESNILFTGGVSNNIGMRRAFEQLLGATIAEGSMDTVFAGALGAAVFAGKFADELAQTQQEEIDGQIDIDISSLLTKVEESRNRFVNDPYKKKAAFLCRYTPIEILASADLLFTRLMHAGSREELSAGETITQGMLCDFTKSVAGGFVNHNPMYDAIDKLYMFYTCTCLVNTLRAVEYYYTPARVFNMPRGHGKDKANEIKFLASEMESFRRDLEALTGKSISDETIRTKTILYNEAKRKICAIADKRRDPSVFIRSSTFQKIMAAYYQVPVEELLPELDDILKQLEKIRNHRNKKIRLMLAGGMIADGDTKLTDILEKDLNAAIVAEDNCMGAEPLRRQIETVGGTVYENLADGYLGQAPCARMKPISEKVEKSVQMAREYQVDGVIYYFLKFCPCHGIVVKEYIDAFEKAGIPLFVLAEDYSKGNEGQIKTRLEAFLEMLDTK